MEPTPLDICNDILPRSMQHYIEKAAAYAWFKNEPAAEANRVAAGYGGLKEKV